MLGTLLYFYRKFNQCGEVKVLVKIETCNINFLYEILGRK